MDDVINRTLEELIVRYELHPELCDIYVESDSDEGLITWYLQQKERYSASVYSIDVVNIPADVVVGHGLEHPSRRSDVIALALELTSQCPADIHVTCIADCDFECFTGIKKESIILLYTDYTSMEMYAYDPTVVDKFLRIVAPRFKATGTEVLERIQGTLQSLFALRIANQELMYGLAWVKIEKCITLKTGVIAFNVDEYSQRYLNTRGKRKHIGAFMAKLAEVQSRLVPDIRSRIRGHDFIDLLTWYLSKNARSCKTLTAAWLRNMLLIQLPVELLDRENLFKVLLARTEGC